MDNWALDPAGMFFDNDVPAVKSVVQSVYCRADISRK
jgi:hypothetical protein